MSFFFFPERGHAISRYEKTLFFSFYKAIINYQINQNRGNNIAESNHTNKFPRLMNAANALYPYLIQQSTHNVFCTFLSVRLLTIL